MALPIFYDLEIYSPGSLSTILVSFSSQTVFPTINKGDIINPYAWEDRAFVDADSVLEVVNVEHLVWQIENHHIGYKIMVFTKKVKDSDEVRLQP